MPATPITRSAADGARIEVHNTNGTAQREREILEFLGRPGPELRVRWTDGRESIRSGRRHEGFPTLSN